MDIKRITIRKLEKGYYKAVASVYLDGYAINGIMVAEKGSQVRLRFPFLPYWSGEDGKRIFAFTPVSPWSRKVMEREIGLAYRAACKEGGTRYDAIPQKTLSNREVKSAWRDGKDEKIGRAYKAKKAEGSL